MLRYRDYDWALVHGESRFEAHFTRRRDGDGGLMWWLRMEYVATGAEWRRCAELDRPHFSLEISSFAVKPGDWRNLREVNHWNAAHTDDFPEVMKCGWLQAEFVSSCREDRERAFTDFGEANWRVVGMDEPLVTVEICGDTEEGNALLGTPEMAATAPGGHGGADEPAGYAGHELYLLETIPFGMVTVQVPRNAPDPLAYAESFSRRHLRTP